MNELEIVVNKLRNRYRVYAIILFGSRARGDWMPWSDYDLLIVADFSNDYLSRMGEILDLLSSIKLPIEPHPYTLDEVTGMLRKGNPIIVDAIEEGTILFYTEEFSSVIKLYRELKKKGLTRTKTSIRVPT